MRRALTAAFGSEIGREATAEALAYGWQHWGRVEGMDNPTGFLYRVGRNLGRRMRRRDPLVDRVFAGESEPWVEPGLPSALVGLSEQERVVVSLIHAFEWSMSEVAGLLRVSKSTVQSYERRAMRKLQAALGVEL